MLGGASHALVHRDVLALWHATRLKNLGLPLGPFGGCLFAVHIALRLEAKASRLEAIAGGHRKYSFFLEQVCSRRLV